MQEAIEKERPRMEEESRALRLKKNEIDSRERELGREEELERTKESLLQDEQNRIAFDKPEVIQVYSKEPRENAYEDRAYSRPRHMDDAVSSQHGQ